MSIAVNIPKERHIKSEHFNSASYSAINGLSVWISLLRSLSFCFFVHECWLPFGMMWGSRDVTYDHLLCEVQGMNLQSNILELSLWEEWRLDEIPASLHLSEDDFWSDQLFFDVSCHFSFESVLQFISDLCSYHQYLFFFLSFSCKICFSFLMKLPSWY